MPNRGGNHSNFAEAVRFKVLARGRSIKNSMSVFTKVLPLFLLLYQVVCKLRISQSPDGFQYPLWVQS
jgi:hypothetical protein